MTHSAESMVCPGLSSFAVAYKYGGSKYERERKQQGEYKCYHILILIIVLLIRQNHQSGCFHFQRQDYQASQKHIGSLQVDHKDSS